MIRKLSKDDEIPLTTSKSTILQETKARFDTLLKAAQSHEDYEKKNERKIKKTPNSDVFKDVKPFKKLSKKKLSTSTQKLVGEEDQSTSSDHDEDNTNSSSPTKVKDFAHVSSSDKILHSPHTENFSLKNSSKTIALVHSNDSSIDLRSNDSQERPIPVPQKRHSLRDESRETTSSRISSPDSVMTAIEATSANWSKDSSPEKASMKGNEEYELKSFITGFSASYEEIDETSLDKNNARMMVSTDNTLTGIENAASYEEILEDSHVVPEHQESDSNQGRSSESFYGEARNTQSRRTKLQSLSYKRRANDPMDNTDSSSNDQVKLPNKQKRHAAQFKKRVKSTMESSTPEPAGTQYTYEKIIGITLHRCDSLKIDSRIRHPMVRIHILDTATGEYLKKSQPNRNVSFYQENLSIHHIQPLASQPCDFKDPRSMTPTWEETLLFNEDIKHILEPNSSTIILFEVLDCVPFDIAVTQYDKLGVESGWHRIAWAFLKPCGPNNIVNIDKRVRLQLYKPRQEKTFRSRNVCEKCDVYRWWSKGGWIQYPSTLHVTVHSLPLPSEVAPAMRSYFALQPEQSDMNSEFSDQEGHDAEDESTSQRMTSMSKITDGMAWSRLPSQSCKVPNQKELNLSSGLNGSFSIRFSHQGKYLAITVANQSMHNIYVYKVPDGSEVTRFQGHPGLVYSLDWSPNDDFLLSASADCTARIWSLKTNKDIAVQMLSHPSFVYCAVFVCASSLSLATGCCDHVIRFWVHNGQTSKFELQQELNGHEGYVSTISVNSHGTLFSGDSTGQIIIWERNEEGSFSLLRTLNVRELQGVLLNHIVLHPGGKRLLVLARDSLLRMIDINTGVAIQWFKGALNNRIHSKACITPCGGLVFAPSEDGTFHVWNADTGQLVASYTTLFHSFQTLSSPDRVMQKFQLSISILSGSVDYHPFEHMAAFAVYGAHAPVTVCKYKKDSLGKDIGLQINQRVGHQAELTDVKKQFKIDTIARSAVLVSNVRAEIRAKKDDKVFEEHQGNAEASIMASKDPTSGAKKQQSHHHLSYIIEQLDYVLQLSRASKQDQLDSASPLAASPSLDVSPQVSSNVSPGIKERETKIHIESMEEVENSATYSTPQPSNTEQQCSKTFEVTKEKSVNEGLPSPQVLVTSPVEIHYVQEKQPPRPAPRHKRSSRQMRVGKQLSTADLSTTDTSLLSSENEDVMNLSLEKSPTGLSYKNRIGHKPTANQMLTLLDKGQKTIISSFDSDSDIQSSKK